MVLASPMWETFGEVPCQYIFNEGFYDMHRVWNPDSPVMLTSLNQTSPDTADKVYFAFCNKMGTATNYAATNCNATVGEYYAMTVSNTDVCTVLSTVELTSITEASWTDSSVPALAVMFSDAQGEYKLQVNLKCDSTPSTVVGPYSVNGTFYTTSYIGPDACPIFTINKMWETIYEYKLVFGGVFIAIGLAMALFGR